MEMAISMVSSRVMLQVIIYQDEVVILSILF